MASILESQRPASGFDASRWLAEWAENGGLYMLIGSEVHLRRMSQLGMSSLRELDRLRAEMFRSGGGPAIADVLLRRRNGDVP
jgi:hypothetical protein